MGSPRPPVSTYIRSSSNEVGALKPFLMAFTPRATARGLLPTPGGPMKSTLSASRTNAHVARASSLEQ